MFFLSDAELSIIVPVQYFSSLVILVICWVFSSLCDFPGTEIENIIPESDKL